MGAESVTEIIRVWSGEHFCTRDEALCSLASLFEGGMGASLAEKVLQAALVREESLSTYLENGLAVPHARVSGLDSIRLSAAYVPGGIPWSDDSSSAELIVFIAVPVSQVSEYLQLMRKLMVWQKSVAPHERPARWGDPSALRAEMAAVLS